MMIAKDHDKIEKFYKEVAKVLPVDGTFQQLISLILCLKVVTKEQLFKKLAEHYNIPIEECVVFWR